jgi:hypothetical protein
MITVSVTGAEDVRQRVLAMAKAAPGRVADALVAEAEMTMADSKLLVPVVTGTLRASGHVQKPVIAQREVSVTMGYGGAASAYALVTHENPRAGATGGVSPSGQRYKRYSRVGQWKYLEQPFLARVSGLTERLWERIVKNWTG